MDMAITSPRDAAIVESLDWLFGNLPERMTGNVIPAEIYDRAALRGNPIPAAAIPGRAEALAAPPQPPPTLDSPAGVQAAYEWFLAERARMEEYTRFQFAAVQEHQQADLARHYRNEQALAARTQDLNRELQFLATQSQTLQARARELAQWESALSAQAHKLTRAHDELLQIHKSSANIQQDTEAQQAKLEQMRAEMAQLQTAQAAARATFASFDTVLAERQQAWEKKQAELAARQTAMEQRYEALEQAEAAAKRRLAELDDLEDHLRQEFESQQRQLVVERKEIDALYAELRGKPGNASPGELKRPR
jgi:DNA repair exonuclease SbcCD ATPase subunit